MSTVEREVGRVISTSLPFHHVRDPARSTVRVFHRGKVVDGIGLLRDINSVCACCCGLRSAISCFCNSLLASANTLGIFSMVGCCRNVLLHVPSGRGPARLRRVIRRRGVVSVFERRRH